MVLATLSMRRARAAVIAAAAAARVLSHFPGDCLVGMAAATAVT
jgi:hypothetical protein